MRNSIDQAMSFTKPEEPKKTKPTLMEGKEGCALLAVKTKTKAMIKVDVLVSIRKLDLLQKMTAPPTKFLALTVEYSTTKIICQGT